MSKIIKLMKKAEQIKSDDQDSVAVADQDVPLHTRPAAESKVSLSDKQGQVSATSNRSKILPSTILFGTSTFLIFIALCISSVSLFLSKNALDEFRLTREVFYQSLSELKLKDEQFAYFDKKISDLNQTSQQQFEMVIAKIDAVSTNLERDYQRFKELEERFNKAEKEMNSVKLKTDDLQLSNKLLRDKAISLNERVKKLQEELTRQEGDL